MLNRLALGGWGTLGDGASDENYELLDAGPLEVAEMAHVRRVRQYDRIRPFRDALQHQQGRDLHLSFSIKNSFALPLSTSFSLYSFVPLISSWEESEE